MLPAPSVDTTSQWHGLLGEARENLELYPPRAADCERHYAVGQSVWVLNGGKPFAKATIAPSLESTNSKEFAGRFRVRYSDGTHYHCRAGALRPLYGVANEAKTTVIVTALTSHYRQLARLQISPGESTLEIGSDLGACTAVLAESTNAPPTPGHVGVDSESRGRCCRPQKQPKVEATGRAIGIDKSSKSVEEARRRFPGVPFHCVDVLTTPGVLSRLATASTTACSISSSSSSSSDTQPTTSSSVNGPAQDGAAVLSEVTQSENSSFDAVFIDINGNRMIEAVAEVTRLVSRDLAHCPPRLIVIKSSEMAKALQAVLDKQS